ncbi:hypothetical protein FM069_09240 [Pseudomonas mangiferae]|uniref:GGDEF domain-containing protein n=1 Tax=Pseudomonas mangiferae TaxID=2593654 RepID=A0A553H0I0_9PSED|nr:hypothetical protein FM069_09240 [Pseudomonas mangiferae]
MDLEFQEQRVSISCSIGVATALPSMPSNNLEAFIGRADAAIYQAK